MNKWGAKTQTSEVMFTCLLALKIILIRLWNLRFWFGRWSAAKSQRHFCTHDVCFKVMKRFLVLRSADSSGICFKTSPWTEMDVAWLRTRDVVAVVVKIMATNVWYQHGGDTRQPSDSLLSWNSTFGRTFDLHWHLEENRVTFSGECMWDVGVSDGLDGI